MAFPLDPRNDQSHKFIIIWPIYINNTKTKWLISQYLCGCGDILDYIRLFPILIYLSQTVTVKMKFEKFCNFLWRLLLNQNLWRAENKNTIPVCIKEQNYQLFSRTLVKTIELYLQFLCPATHYEKIQVETSQSLNNIFLRKLKHVSVILQQSFSSSWSISQNIVIRDKDLLPPRLLWDHFFEITVTGF